MTSWNIKPAEVQRVLTDVQTRNTTLTSALTQQKFAAIGAGITWGGALTQEVSVAVNQVMTEQGENLTVIQNHINAGLAGVANATIAYNHGQYDMAATFQSEALKSAESGDFQYFVEHGSKE